MFWYPSQICASTQSCLGSLQKNSYSNTPSHLAKWDYHFIFKRTVTQHTSRLCKGYFTKKEHDGVLHQMTWPPQSPNLNPVEMFWDELDHRVKVKQPTSAQHMWELLQDC
uniref:Tc1-like transposase DDE domain-containing protein n=1 Tax=Oncorhynchus tshawytscha TaxID=74940 RepID=A0AAZ3NRD3_ONCTS